MVQIVFIICIWSYARADTKFKIIPAHGLDMMIARFLGSLMMHMNVEKKIQDGLKMMKYASNHHDSFTNITPPFVIAWTSVCINLCVEANVMIILSTMPDVMNVIMKYVSLAAIANIPNYYYGSLADHKMMLCVKKPIHITNFRY